MVSPLYHSQDLSKILYLHLQGENAMQTDLFALIFSTF